MLVVFVLGICINVFVKYISKIFFWVFKLYFKSSVLIICIVFLLLWIVLIKCVVFFVIVVFLVWFGVVRGNNWVSYWDLFIIYSGEISDYSLFSGCLINVVFNILVVVNMWFFLFYI